MVRKPIALLIGALLLIGASSLLMVYADALNKPVAPIIPKAKGDQCVADTALMRTDHMDFLNHQRDDTVIDGKRSEPFSIVACVDCHAQTTAEGVAVRIDAPGQFCESCHTYAAVKIDCFTCHAAVPEQKELVGLRSPHELLKHNSLMSELSLPDPHRVNLSSSIFAERHGKQP